MECDKIGSGPYDGCLRTLDGRIKPFIVRLGVKILRPVFQRDLYGLVVCYVDIIGHVSEDGILCWIFVSLERMFSGLKACAVESQPLCDFLMNCVSRFKSMFLFVLM